MEKLYKFLTADGRGTYSNYQWPLPTATEPGAWVKVEGKLIPCENGLHLCRPEDLRHWFAATLYEAEYRGARLNEDNKIIVAEARLLRLVPTWNKRTMVLFACDCAEHVLPLFESQFPNDARPREAIAAARRCVETGSARAAGAAGAAGAARAARTARAAGAAGAARAAWAAGAARAAWAAGDAVWAARTAEAAGEAAWAAGAAGAAEAAGDAAWAGETDWQNARLLAYITGEIV